MKKKLTRNSPRQLSAHSWYYVNDRTVDIITDANVTPRWARVNEQQLRQMLSELKPKRKSKSGVPRSAGSGR